MISVGRRSEAGDGWSDQGRLARTAAYLRGSAALVPRGIYTFDSFEEADAWMTRTMIATHLCLSRKTSARGDL